MSVAIRDATAGSTPNWCSPMSASPESLRRIGLYTGSGRAGSDGIGEIIAVFVSFPVPGSGFWVRRSGFAFGSSSGSAGSWGRTQPERRTEPGTRNGNSERELGTGTRTGNGEHELRTQNRNAERQDR